MSDVLPIIVCYGNVYTPRLGVSPSEITYSVGVIVGSNECLVGKIRDNKGTDSDVTPTSQFSIVDDLNQAITLEPYCILTAAGTFVSALVTSYYLGLKRDYVWGIPATLITATFATAYWYCKEQDREVCFDLANRILTVYQGKTELVYKASDYDVSNVPLIFVHLIKDLFKIMQFFYQKPALRSQILKKV